MSVCLLRSGRWWLGLVVAWVSTVTAWAAPRTWNVRDFGARGDGVTLDTVAIQAAFDAASHAGGGRVTLADGTFLSGSLLLRSNVEVFVDEGAELHGAANDIGAYFPAEESAYADYQDFGHTYLRTALLVGESVENITLSGRGRIHGGGLVRSTPKAGGGNKLISLRECRHVLIRDLTLYQGGHIAVLMNGCRGVEIAHVEILTSRDAINVIGTRDVQIHHSRISGTRYAGPRPETVEGTKIEGGDDAIGLKSDFALGRVLPVENVRIWNCELTSGGANGIQFGSETIGDFRNIRIWNIVIKHAGKAGIGITTNDGAIVEDVHISNVTIQHAETPIYFTTTRRMRRPDTSGVEVGRIRNVTLENIIATDPGSVARDMEFTATLSGLPESPLENVVLRNIAIATLGGKGAGARDRSMPYPTNYSPRELGERPAWALYARHVRGLTLENAIFTSREPDQRPALEFTDVTDVKFDHVSANGSAVPPATRAN